MLILMNLSELMMLVLLFCCDFTDFYLSIIITIVLKLFFSYEFFKFFGLRSNINLN